MSAPLQSSRPLSLQEQLLQDCQDMARHALSIGRAVPPAMLQGLHAAASAPPKLAPSDLKKLAATHSHLSRLIAPATPETLSLMHKDARSKFRFLGPLPFVRRMILASLCCLAVFIGLRLALLGSFARRGATLPLVLDDVLVNFDTERVRCAAEVLCDFARQDHQVIMFTCHEHITDIFEDAGGQVRVLPSRDGTIRVRQRRLPAIELPAVEPPVVEPPVVELPPPTPSVLPDEPESPRKPQPME